MSARGDEAVSDVVGNILLVGITVAVMAGMSLAVLAIGGPEDTLHADLRVDVLRGGSSWGDGDEAVRLRHVGGEPVPAGVEVTVVLDGAPTTLVPADQGFADGALRMGESWSATLTIPEGSELSVLVVDRAASALVASTGVLYGATTGVGAVGGVGIPGGGGGGGGSVTTYVSSGSATTGTLTGFSGATSADDGGAFATLAEATVAGAPTTARLDPSSSSSPGLADHADVRLSDNDRTRFIGQGDEVQAEGFSVPADATVTGVVVGFEAQRSGTGGSPKLTLTYTVAGAAGPSGLTATVLGGVDEPYTLDVTGHRASWTPQDVADLRLRLVRDSTDSGSRDADVDHLYVEVTYTRPATDLVATFGFTGVPARATHQLQVGYSTSGDAFGIEVRSGSSWVSVGTLDSAAPTTFTHALTAAQYNGGAPQLRFRDLDTGAGAGELRIDHARVEST